jgi:hypothetical protein
MIGGPITLMLLLYFKRYLKDLKEVVSTMFLVDHVRWLLKIRAMRLSLVEYKEPLDLLEDKVSDHKVEETIRGLRTKHPMAATILEKNT